MFPNDTVPVFNGFTFQTNLVGPIKNFPIHSILFHINKCSALASYHLSLYVINYDQNHVTHDGCVGSISTNTNEKAISLQLNSINI